MKKLFTILVVAGISALITYLAISKYMAQERATSLNKALLEAETRIVQLEADIDRLSSQVQDLTAQAASRASIAGSQTGKTTGSSAKTGVSSGQTNLSESPPSNAQTASSAITPTTSPGPLVRYVVETSSGFTNMVRIEGTSSIHSWQVEGHLIGGMAEIQADSLVGGGAEPEAGRSIPTRINSFIPVRSLRSVEADGTPYSNAMDEIMYQKLRAQAHGRIMYSLNTLTVKGKSEATPGAWDCEATGSLAVAGKTNELSTPVTIFPSGKKHLQITGNVGLKMTDFEISPPSPSLAGVSIKTGDEVNVRFVWWVRRQ